MTSDNDFLRLKCDTFDPENIIFKNMKPKMLYPMYRSLTGPNNYRNDPIVIQTPYVALQGYPISSYDYNSPNPPFHLYRDDEKAPTIEMSQIFGLFSSLDDHTIKNLETIMSNDTRIKKNKTTYLTCVKSKDIKGKSMSYINFKYNWNVGGQGEQNASEVVVEQQQNNGLPVPVVKVYYKSTYQDSKYKMHTLQELGKILKPGQKVRFILAINKMWFTDFNIGYGIKIMQMELDTTCQDKFKLLKSLKNNEMNMFDKSQDKKNSSFNRYDKYDEYLQRNIKCGSTKVQKQKANEKIIKIINESEDKYLFDDDEYVQYESASVAI